MFAQETAVIPVINISDLLRTGHGYQGCFNSFLGKRAI